MKSRQRACGREAFLVRPRRSTLILEDDLFDAVAALARAEERSVSFIVRKAVREYLERNTKKA